MSVVPFVCTECVITHPNDVRVPCDASANNLRLYFCPENNNPQANDIMRVSCNYFPRLVTSCLKDIQITYQMKGRHVTLAPKGIISGLLSRGAEVPARNSGC